MPRSAEFGYLKCNGKSGNLNLELSGLPTFGFSREAELDTAALGRPWKLSPISAKGGRQGCEEGGDEGGDEGHKEGGEGGSRNFLGRWKDI